MVQLCLRDRLGNVSGGLSMHYTSIGLKAPTKNERCIVLVGKDAGRVGKVSVSSVSSYIFCLTSCFQYFANHFSLLLQAALIGKETLVAYDDDPQNTIMVRTRYLAWLNSVRS
jgi:hypothetical protein